MSERRPVTAPETGIARIDPAQRDQTLKIENLLRCGRPHQRAYGAIGEIVDPQLHSWDEQPGDRVHILRLI
jgi:hypothetical protein